MITGLFLWEATPFRPLTPKKKEEENSSTRCWLDLQEYKVAQFSQWVHDRLPLLETVLEDDSCYYSLLSMTHLKDRAEWGDIPWKWNYYSSPTMKNTSRGVSSNHFVNIDAIVTLDTHVRVRT